MPSISDQFTTTVDGDTQTIIEMTVSAVSPTVASTRGRIYARREFPSSLEFFTILGVEKQSDLTSSIVNSRGSYLVTAAVGDVNGE